VLNSGDVLKKPSIVVVLNEFARPILKKILNYYPVVPYYEMGKEESKILCLREHLFVQRGAQIEFPPLPALFTGFFIYFFSYLAPVPAKLFHQRSKSAVLFKIPEVTPSFTNSFLVPNEFF